MWCLTQPPQNHTVGPCPEFVKSSLHSHNLFFIISFHIIFHNLHTGNHFLPAEHLSEVMELSSHLMKHLLLLFLVSKKQRSSESQSELLAAKWVSETGSYRWRLHMT
jgi:hypothetical protein